MSPVASFLSGLLVTVVSALLVAFYLRARLRRILIDVCGTTDRAEFWTAVSLVTLVLVPVICALFPEPEGGRPSTVFFDIAAQLRWALIGLVIAIGLISLVISRFVPRHS